MRGDLILDWTFLFYCLMNAWSGLKYRKWTNGWTFGLVLRTLDFFGVKTSPNRPFMTKKVGHDAQDEDTSKYHLDLLLCGVQDGCKVQSVDKHVTLFTNQIQKRTKWTRATR